MCVTPPSPQRTLVGVSAKAAGRMLDLRSQTEVPPEPGRCERGRPGVRKSDGALGLSLAFSLSATWCRDILPFPKQSTVQA